MKGIILVISGPAGVGKTTLCDRLLKKYTSQLCRTITVTTRNPRANEVNGIDYIFMSKQEFQNSKNNDLFLEYAQIHGNWYGSLKNSVLDKLESSYDVLMNIDIQGMLSLKKMENKFSCLTNKIHTVFINPQSIGDLRERLNQRGLDSSQNIEERLKTAKIEIESNHAFDKIILSKTKDEDFHRLEKFYLSKSLVA